MSKIRKEEAELRRIAKQSRLARKEAHARERKQKQRETRARAKAQSAGEPVLESKSEGDSTNKSAVRRRQGAIILPEEVRELRQRLHLEENGIPAATEEEEAVTSPAKAAGRKAKKAAASPQAKTTTSGTSSTAAVPSSPSSSSVSSTCLTPNHRLEIHYRRKQVLVDVVLHHVPVAKIDVSGTTPTQLVVDTTKHSKKYRLVLPMPEGIRIAPSEAEYESEGGILKCILPIQGGVIPESLQKEWDRVMDAVQQQRALRFRVGKDGELNVRSRTALLAKEAADAPRRPAGEHRHNGAGEGDEAAEGTPKVAAPPAPAGSKTRAAAPGMRKKRPRAEEDADSDGGDDAKDEAAVRGTTASHKKRKSGGAEADVFAIDHAKAMEAAKAAAASAQRSIRERVRLAKEVQAQRQARIKTRSERRVKKQESIQASFLRVLDDQKQQLAAKAQLAAAVEEAEKRHATAKKEKSASSTGKRVSFA